MGIGELGRVGRSGCEDAVRNKHVPCGKWDVARGYCRGMSFG